MISIWKSRGLKLNRFYKITKGRLIFKWLNNFSLKNRITLYLFKLFSKLLCVSTIKHFAKNEIFSKKFGFFFGSWKIAYHFLQIVKIIVKNLMVRNTLNHNSKITTYMEFIYTSQCYCRYLNRSFFFAIQFS